MNSSAPPPPSETNARHEVLEEGSAHNDSLRKELEERLARKNSESSINERLEQQLHCQQESKTRSELNGPSQRLMEYIDNNHVEDGHVPKPMTSDVLDADILR